MKHPKIPEGNYYITSLDHSTSTDTYDITIEGTESRQTYNLAGLQDLPMNELAELVMNRRTITGSDINKILK